MGNFHKTSCLKSHTAYPWNLNVKISHRTEIFIFYLTMVQLQTSFLDSTTIHTDAIHKILCVSDVQTENVYEFCGYTFTKLSYSSLSKVSTL